MGPASSIALASTRRDRSRWSLSLVEQAATAAYPTACAGECGKHIACFPIYGDTLPLALGATIDDGRDRLEAADGGVRQIARDCRGERGAIGRGNGRQLAAEIFGNLGRE